MTKKYKASSHVCITITLSTGGTKHISFNQLTGGGSVYYTDNEVIQQGLESHPKYGKLFVETAMPAPVLKKEEVKAPAKERVMEFGCNDDAKDYLSDKFGISRTKMMSRKAIEAAAAANGIKVVWTDQKE